MFYALFSLFLRKEIYRVHSVAGYAAGFSGKLRRNLRVTLMAGIIEITAVHAEQPRVRYRVRYALEGPADDARRIEANAELDKAELFILA